MPSIPVSLVTYFKDLANNNNQEWFTTHEQRFLDEVRLPFIELANALWPILNELERDIPDTPEKCISPMHPRGREGYPTMIKANFMPTPEAAFQKNRRLDLPGYYLGIGIEQIHVGGGLFSPDRNSLPFIRRHIKSNPQYFQKLIQDPVFLSEFGGLQGESVRRPGPEFNAIAMAVPEIANKEWYYIRGYRTEDLLETDTVVELLTEHYRQIAPLNAFFRTALLGEDEEDDAEFGSGFFNIPGQ
jgi:uncharacterized protein (TIGR02453 family)